MSELAQFPHCDQRVLHAPSDGCEFCNDRPEWQELRNAWGIAFTGHTPLASLPKCGQEVHGYSRADRCQRHEGHDGDCSPAREWERLPCPADAARPPGSPSDHRRWGGNKPTSATGDPSWPAETAASRALYGDRGGRQPVATTPQPGDFAVVSSGGLAGKLVAFGEKLNGSAFTQYQHAFIYLGDGQIVQAEPAGASVRPLTGHAVTLWSTGIIPLTETQRQAIVNAAHRYAAAKTDYSFLDYLALAAHRLHISVPGLKRYIKSTGHMICSQLVDQGYEDAGVHLFKGRWNGYVTPADLAERLS